MAASLGKLFDTILQSFVECGVITRNGQKFHVSQYGICPLTDAPGEIAKPVSPSSTTPQSRALNNQPKI